MVNQQQESVRIDGSLRLKERLGDLAPKHCKDNSVSVSYSVPTELGFAIIIIELVD